MRNRTLGLLITHLLLIIFLTALSPASSASSGEPTLVSGRADVDALAWYGDWSGTLHRFDTGANSGSPIVAHGHEQVHVVWEEEGHLYHSHGQGDVWSDPIRIAVGDSPAMAVDAQGRLHLVWANELGDIFQVFYAVWNGTAWTPPQAVFETSAHSGSPDVAIALGVEQGIHVVWADYLGGQSAIYYAESADGSEWLEGMWIPRATGRVPAIAVEGDGTVHAVWQDDSELGNGRNDIYYRQRSAEGNWGNVSENISQSPDVDSTAPDVVIDGAGTVHLVWEEGVDGLAVVDWGYGRAGAWEMPTALSAVPSYSPLPSIATDGHSLYAAWTAEPRLLLKQKKAEAVHWGDPQVLAENQAGIRDGYLSVDHEGQLHAVWSEKEADGIWDIHYGRQVGEVATPTPTSTQEPTLTPTSTHDPVTPTPTASITPHLTQTSEPTATPTITLPAVTASPTSAITPSPTQPSETLEPKPLYLPGIYKSVPLQHAPAVGQVPEAPRLEEAEADVRPAAASPIPASLTWTWTDPLNLSDTGLTSRAPAILIGPDRKIHVVWEEGSSIYHRYWDGGAWTASQKVVIGERPAFAFGPDGTLHLTFANEFGGNMEVYYVSWSEASGWGLPSNVSATSGASSNPDIAVGSDGTVHIAWADTTPGYSVIYYAYGNGATWSTWFVPNAFGTEPSMAVTSTDVVMLAWQDRYAPEESYDIYFSERDDGDWSLPVGIDDTWDADSVSCDLVVGLDDRAHIVWQEEVDGRYQIYYCEQNAALWWTIPFGISSEYVDALLPAIAVDSIGDLQVVWDETTLVSYRRLAVASSEWSPITTIASNSVGIADADISSEGQREAHVVWSRHVGGDDWDVFYQRQVLDQPYHLCLPLTYSD